MFYIYVLQNKEDTEGFYVGFTGDLKKRIVEHNSGKNFSTKGFQWKLIYYEACLSEKDAKRREKYLKTSIGRRMLKRRIKEYLSN